MRFTLITLAAFAVACVLRPCSAQKTITSSPTPSPSSSMPPSSASSPVAPSAAPSSAQPTPARESKGADLTIGEYEFAPNDERTLRVNVANIGAAEAGVSVLRMKVMRIKGYPVGRVSEIEVPAIPANGNVWVSLQTDQIIPKDVRLRDTVFRLNLDVRNAVKEANEENNERWHNQNQPARQTSDDG